MAYSTSSPDLATQSSDTSEAEGVSTTAEREISRRFSLHALSQFATGQFAALSQRRYAREGAKTALTQYQKLRVERAELSGQDLYAAFVCQRNEIEDSAARRILKCAADSFAVWPEDRDLIFQDVAKYLIISEYLAINAHRAGTTIDMDRVIGQIIPKAL
jgi:hypothetical protein